MIKVYIAPDYIDNPSETGGIRRVVDAQVEHLPKFGIQVVHNPAEAHIINNHGGMLVSRPGIPMVSTGHGLYWSRQKWGDNFQDVNRQVIESMCQSVAHTAPSQWVSDAIRRGGLFYPEVVYHGVDAEKFTPSKEPGKYVVWAKARADAVSDPNDMLRVAQLLPAVKFVSTIGIPSENVQVLMKPPFNIPVPYSEMRDLVANAAVYLSTARETFGIGTLEALACGVPVAGWDCGGNSEIIIQGKTGYLAPWGDFGALADCIERCIAERDVLSKNCVEDARTRWKWEPRIEQYANIFKRVYETYYNRGSKPKISAIVTAYKLDQYLPDCLRSISDQSYKDFECIVVDDAQLESTQTIVAEFSKQDPRIRYLPTPYNLKLSGARNFGFSQAQGLFIRHIDADDILSPEAFALEAQVLENDHSTHIVYGHLEVIREDGSRILNGNGDPQRSGWPGPEYNWFQQMAHLNQLPSTVMVRREVYERSGGYRERMKRAEDAEFWCRVTSLGFRANKITQAVTLFHRERQDSKGATEWQREGKEPDWTSWFPWRMGASDYGEGREKYRKFGDRSPNPHLVPFSAQGRPNNMRSWYVHDYAYPVVSVIITCGPGHRRFLIDALDSVQAQTFPDWECIVVNDTGDKWAPDIMGAPWAKVINMPANVGTAQARNEGYKHIRGKYVVWLDADDYWMPWFLEKMVAYAEKNDGVIFSDLIKGELTPEGKEKFSLYTYQEFNCDAVRRNMTYPGTSVLYPRKITDAIFKIQGGFDTQIPGMEDWDFQFCVHANGFCAFHIEEPLFVYRLHTSTKREKDYNQIDKITDYMNSKWRKHREGGEAMPCGCASPKKLPENAPTSLMTASGNFTAESLSAAITPENERQMVEVEYLGPITDDFSIRSRIMQNVIYRFGNNDYSRVRAVFLKDAAFLTGIVDNYNRPLYRVIATGPTLELRDPTAVLGSTLEMA